MREEIAQIVYPVFTHGIRLKERLASGEEMEFATAQKELQGLLQSTLQAQRWTGAPADKSAYDSVRAPQGDAPLGITYALACWLDEIFILDSTWSKSWEQQSLEWERFHSNERAWKFWKQADMASARSTPDALEVYYLCVMLGFRGDKAEKPDELKAWCERIKAQIDQGQDAEYKPPVEGQPRFNAPSLRGTRRMQNMLVVAGVALLILVPVIAFLLVFPFAD